jgi:hypothetical protein
MVLVSSFHCSEQFGAPAGDAAKIGRPRPSGDRWLDRRLQAGAGAFAP